VTKPVALPVNVDGIPDSLKCEPRWSTWDYRLDDKGRQVKQPDGKSNDPSTWLTFAEARVRYQSRRRAGLLFALGDGHGGGDLDHCRVQGVTLPVARALIRIFEKCYCERSPSDTGYKVFFRASRVGFQADFAAGFAQFTRWHAPRFFTVTGHGSGDPTADGDHPMSLVLPPEQPPEPSGAREGYADAHTTSDDDLLLLMVGNDINGDDILALWRGEMSAYGEDHSRADMALLRHLAFWTDYDAERMDRLFRQSGLMRPHWAKSASYRRASLGKALR
jgi:primase-polymerase (primpol)-like protein